MFNKTKIALAAILVLGAASAALAGGKDDDGWGHDRGEGTVQTSRDIQRSQEWVQRQIQLAYHHDNSGGAFALEAPAHKRAVRKAR